MRLGTDGHSGDHGLPPIVLSLKPGELQGVAVPSHGGDGLRAVARNIPLVVLGSMGNKLRGGLDRAKIGCVGLGAMGTPLHSEAEACHSVVA